MNEKIAIQGFEGSFHQAAARKFFGDDVEVVCCSTFKELVQRAQTISEADGGVMAIENSIAGSILPNYNLLQNSNLEIVGEVFLEINQNLLVNPGVKLEDIREVHSHPMALLQCSDYLEKFEWKLVETDDTALSAKHIHENKSLDVAAIASDLAADIYGLDIISPSIHTCENNYTRFLVLKNADLNKNIENANKASLIFEADHSKGSLAKILLKISDCDINLSKLQSMPIPGSDWKYSFYADCEFTDVAQLNKLLDEISPYTNAVKVNGIYKNGKITTINL
ncbi:MAG TPA: prephenate dehydratase [Brumimicrobium sp.]|nr:prephenate dehydratase [Brumimicrobium sp.]